MFSMIALFFIFVNKSQKTWSFVDGTDGDDDDERMMIVIMMIRDATTMQQNRPSSATVLQYACKPPIYHYTLHS